MKKGLRLSIEEKQAWKHRPYKAQDLGVKSLSLTLQSYRHPLKKAGGHIFTCQDFFEESSIKKLANFQFQISDCKFHICRWGQASVIRY